MPFLTRQRALLLALLCFGSSAQAGPLLDKLREKAEARRAAESPSPSATRVLRNVAYGQHRQETMDLYLPSRRTQGAPVIFMVHGGAWKIGDKAHTAVVQNKTAHWLPLGLALISVNYPMLPDAPPQAQAAALTKALAFAQAHAGEWGLDPTRFVLMGHSAGAHLIALINASPATAKAHGARPWLGAVSLDSAAMDVPAIMGQPHYGFYDEAFGTNPGDWPVVSPRHQLTREAPPFLMVCATRRQDACPQADAMATTAQSLQVETTILRQDLSHQDINEKLGLSNAYTAQVDAFLKRLGVLD